MRFKKLKKEFQGFFKNVSIKCSFAILLLLGSPRSYPSRRRACFAHCCCCCCLTIFDYFQWCTQYTLSHHTLTGRWRPGVRFPDSLVFKLCSWWSDRCHGAICPGHICPGHIFLVTYVLVDIYSVVSFVLFDMHVLVHTYSWGLQSNNSSPIWLLHTGNTLHLATILRFDNF